MSRFLDVLVAVGPWNTRTLVVALTVFALAVGTRFPKFLLVVAIGLYALVLVNPAVLVLPGVVDLRLVGLALGVYVAMLRQRMPRLAVLRTGIFPASLAYVLIGLAFVPVAADAGVALDGLLGTVVTVAFAWLILCSNEGDEIRWALRWVTGVVVLGSVVWVQVDPGAALLGERWRGLVANPNSLGIFAAIFLLTAAPRRGRWGVAPVLAVLIGTASRAATFGLGLVAAPRLLEGQSRLVRRAATVVAVLCAIPILHAVFFSSADASGGRDSAGITRTSNSRSEYWQEGLDVFFAQPFTGVGIGSQPGLTTSSVIGPLAEIGILATVPLALVVAAALAKSRAKLSWSRSLFFFLCVNGFFEMWLFAGGSFFYLAFLLAAPSSVGAERAARQLIAGDELALPAISGGAGRLVE